MSVKPPEKDLREVSATRVRAALAAYGQHKRLALDAELSDTELSRLLNDHLPKFTRLLELLGLEVVEAGHVDDLRRVLKQVL